jgi:hypothetical protein
MNKPASSLSQFIEEYPLYLKYGVNQPIEAADLNNLAFNFFCKNEKAIQPFKLEAAAHNGMAHTGATNGRGYTTEGTTVDFTEMFSGVCQSCQSYKANIIISGGTQQEKPKYFIRKIGQYPAPESHGIQLSKEITGFLNEDGREFYRKALQNLELEYGLGAITYFKKMIAMEIERIIEAISDPYSANGNKIAEAMDAYKKEQQKSKLIELITPHLPNYLKEHGAAILLLLQDTVSIGIHELSEEECIKRSKDINTLFSYLVKQITRAKNETFSIKNSEKYFLRYRQTT